MYSRRHVCRLARLLACSKYLWLGHEARVFAYHFGRRPAVLGATCRLLGEVQAPNWVGEAPDYGALTPITVALARHKSEGCLRCVVSGSNDCYLDVLALACPASRWPWARSPLNDTGCRPGWRSHCFKRWVDGRLSRGPWPCGRREGGCPSGSGRPAITGGQQVNCARLTSTHFVRSSGHRRARLRCGRSF